MPANSSKAVPPTTEQPLVNETEPPAPPTYEELQKQLADSREEVSRGSKQLTTLRESMTEMNKQLETLKRQPVQLATTSRVAPSDLNPEDYEGPSQSEIYLAMIAGFTSALNPLKLENKMVNDMAESFCGMAEVFHSKTIARPSFYRD